MVIVLIILIILVVCVLSSLFNKENEEPHISFTEMKKNTARKLIETKEIPSTQILPCVKSIDVRGTYYRNTKEKAAARDVEVGDSLILQEETDNPVDPNAVKVMTINGVHIGYVQYDIAQFVKRNILHVKSCTVVKKSVHEIPYITATAYFSKSECKQLDFIESELRVSPEDKMNDLLSGHTHEYKYRQVVLTVKATFEQSNEAIDKARGLRQGDKIILQKVESSDLFPYRIDVFTEDHTFIGFCYGRFTQEPYELFDKIHKVLVDAPMQAYYHESLILRVFLPENIEWKGTIEIGREYSGPYPQLYKARQIKNGDPLTALDLALPIANKEKGITGKFLCCQIYRQLKDYESERKMILNILERIETVDPSYISKDEYSEMQKNQDSILKRLNTVESRLNSKSPKKNPK